MRLRAAYIIVVGYPIFFATDSGIRQGCPFLPLAFVLAVEYLATKIRKSGIKGIKNLFGENLNRVIKIALYADDITFFRKRTRFENNIEYY